MSHVHPRVRWSRTVSVRLAGTVSVLLLLIVGAALRETGPQRAVAGGTNVAEVSGVLHRANGDELVITVLVDTNLAEPEAALLALEPEAEISNTEPGEVTGAFVRWVTWPASRIPLPIRYNAAGGPAGIDASGLVRSTAETWNAVSGHGWRFDYAGTTAGGTDVCDESGASDGAVTVGWRNDLPLGILARTCALIRPSPSGRAPVEMDVGFSAKVPWSTAETTPVASYDLQSTLLHELGHVIGLEHSLISGAVMLPQISSGTQRRTLTADDIAGIRALYPAAATPPTNLPTRVRVAAIARE